MWEKVTNEKYKLKLDSSFRVEFTHNDEWELINDYNGDEAVLSGFDTKEILEDAFDLILTRFMSDVVKVATNAQKMLTYIDNFINNAIEIDSEMKFLGTMSADMKQKTLEIIIESQVTNHTEEVKK